MDNMMDDLSLAQKILEGFEGYETCSIYNLRERCVTFLKEPGLTNLQFFLGQMFHPHSIFNLQGPEDLVVIAPKGIDLKGKGFEVIEADEPEVVFVKVHNGLNEWREPAEDSMSFPGSEIDPMAVIGVEGLKIVQAKNGERIAFKHMGNVVIKDGARVGAGAVIHRACLDSTVIEKDAIVGALCNVGHNAIIGERTILTAGVMVGGSARISKDCWVGMGAMIGNGVSICDKVMIGMGSVVTKHIKSPGVYFGSPARWHREWDGRWRTEDRGRRTEDRGQRTEVGTVEP